ncbi:MAG: DUF3006 domain-containing protein [Clostridia bacterium]|nr:DUF3006 domain-containing protein [Clostridia bacterium]MBQ7100338.1 DUF3006 domain-containing protein [Clostridia bacterium]
MKKLTVDRVEENIAVCTDENETLTQIFVSDLPFEVREGTIIIFNDDGTIEHDTNSEENRRKELFDLQESLFDE